MNDPEKIEKQLHQVYQKESGILGTSYPWEINYKSHYLQPFYPFGDLLPKEAIEELATSFLPKERRKSQQFPPSSQKKDKLRQTKIKWRWPIKKKINKWYPPLPRLSFIKLHPLRIVHFTKRLKGYNKLFANLLSVLYLYRLSFWQFQALFHSLFRVLFIFPSQYLFAIGLLHIFSLGWSLPPILGLQSQTTRLHWEC